jgi:hypothetical protein
MPRRIGVAPLRSNDGLRLRQLRPSRCRRLLAGIVVDQFPWQRPFFE